MFNGVKVFSATMVADRDRLGDKVATWMADARARGITPLESIVRQSSDEAFHCVSITVFFHEPRAVR